MALMAKDPTLVVTLVGVWSQYQAVREAEPEVDKAEFAVRCSDLVRDQVLAMLEDAERERNSENQASN